MAKGMMPPASAGNLHNAPALHPTANNDNGNMNAQRSSLGLPLNPLAIPLYTAPATKEDVQEGGQILFENFVREEFEHEGLPDPPRVDPVLEGGGDAAAAAELIANPEDCTDNSAPFRNRRRRKVLHDPPGGDAPLLARSPEGYKNFGWTKLGRSLRELADQFSRSQQGEEVRRHAEMVNLNDINEDRFWNLLIELFTDGFSKERLIALFCFCTTLIIRAARQNGMELTRDIFSWSLSYIRSKVSQWVYDNGGWERVLGNLYTVLFRVAVVGALLVGIVCGIVYIKKNL